MHTRLWLHRNLMALALATGVMVLWLLTHGYQGFVGDAQIYAFQALARIQTALSNDLYLQYGSQDRFTIFSPIYALFIQWIGLDSAARLLTLFFTAALFFSAWNLAAAILNRRAAWLAIAFLTIGPVDYGASGVFHLAEPYLTARLPAEALIISAFACYSRGMRLVALLFAILAVAVHPLMAFPALLLLACLSFPIWIALIGATIGIALTLSLALAASLLPAIPHVLMVMDPDWVDVVRERSQFLFPSLWSVRDWDINIRPLAYLIFMSAAVEDSRIRNFCMASLLVGLAGIAVALVADLIEPIAILVQGQAWRWVWLSCFISVLLLPSTVLRVWHNKKCGPLCAVLLVCGWMISSVTGTVCVCAAVVIWMMQVLISDRAVIYLRWIATLLWIAAVAWAEGTSLRAIASRAIVNASLALNKVEATIGVKVLTAVFFVLLWLWLQRNRTIWVPVFACAVLLVSSIFIISASPNQARPLASGSEIEAFSDWRAAIPPTSTVFVAPAPDVGTFVWFTLGRPNYLALDQSAGVVFSRETALEVRRRSEILQPLTDPTWKILSGIRSPKDSKHNAATRPLTTQTLLEVCGDSLLGFVASSQNVGFDPLRHEHAGPFKDWYLYDCAHVRQYGDLKARDAFGRL